MRLIIAAALLVVGLSSALASPVYDRNGNLIANNVANGDGSATVYDRNGNQILHTVQRGKTFVTYDRNGRVVGTSRLHGSTMTNYDSAGRVSGKVTGVGSNSPAGSTRRGRWHWTNGAFYQH
jgi:YD repeat-containing protein